GRLFLRPMALRAGVGCRRGTPKAAILAALKESAARIGMPMEAITSLGSTVFKREERGLHEVAAELRRPLYFYANDVLQRIIEQYGLRESDFVRQTIGIGNVCEAAALAAGGGRMALGKTRFEKVTVALVWQQGQEWQESQ
ncbi:cobalamin biosynthesis protein, partial [Mitsuokella multacida]